MEEREYYFSGYCRCLDGARTVEVLVEAGQVTEVDCAWSGCIHRSVCPIAKEIDKLNQ